MIYNTSKKKWINLDTAFISTSNFNYLPFKSSLINNLYTAGPHTGKQEYHFTSMESAVSNGIALSLDLYPELKKFYSVKRVRHVRDIFLLIIFILLILFFIKIMYKRYRIKK